MNPSTKQPQLVRPDRVKNSGSSSRRHLKRRRSEHSNDDEEERRQHHVKEDIVLEGKEKTSCTNDRTNEDRDSNSIERQLNHLQRRRRQRRKRNAGINSDKEKKDVVSGVSTNSKEPTVSVSWWKFSWQQKDSDNDDDDESMDHPSSPNDKNNDKETDPSFQLWMQSCVSYLPTTVGPRTPTSSSAVSARSSLLDGSGGQIENDNLSMITTSTTTTTTARFCRPTSVQRHLWKSVWCWGEVKHTNKVDHETRPPISTTHRSVRSAVLLAPTGSGKTLAYGAILLNLVSSSFVQGEPARHGLVLVPTRELVVQIRNELDAAQQNRRRWQQQPQQHQSTSTTSSNTTTANHVSILAIYGGVNRHLQQQALERATANSSNTPVIVVATTGRLADLLHLNHSSPSTIGEDPSHIPRVAHSSTSHDHTPHHHRHDESSSSSLAHLSFCHIVVDEADRMALQPDLSAQVICLLSHFSRTSRHTNNNHENHHGTLYLASATMPARASSMWNTWMQQCSQDHERRVVMVRVNHDGSHNRSNHATNDNDKQVNHHSTTPTTSTSSATATRTKNQHQHDTDKADDDDEASDVTQTHPAVAPSKDATHHSHSHDDDDHDEDSVADNRNRHAHHNDWLAQIPSNVTQVLDVCSEHKKPRKLMRTLMKARSEHGPLGIIFFNTIKKLRMIANLLSKEPSVGEFGELHSHMDQTRRDKAIRCFQSGRVPLLLATDVAARGIHVSHVSFVVQYDFPTRLEQYVHRCGRAGRRGHGTVQAKGAAVYSFFTRNLAPMAADVVRLLERCSQRVDPNLVQLAQSNSSSLSSNAKQHVKRSGRHDRASIQHDLDQDDDEDEFQELSHHHIVLQRASHVCDDDSSSSDDE